MTDTADIARKYEELRAIIDGGSESMTHEDAVAEIKELVEKDGQLYPEPPKKKKPIKYFNGRCLLTRDSFHGYICATSKAEAVRLAKKAFGEYFTMNELNTYWSNCWGTCAQEVIGEQTEPGVYVEYRGHVFRFLGRSDR